MKKCNKEKILLIGGGGHCESVIDVIESEGKYEIFGVLDKNEDKKNLMGYDFLGSDNKLHSLIKKVSNAFVTVGQIRSPNDRIRLFNDLKKFGFNLPVIVSPYAHVSRHAKIDEGTIVMHQAMINAGSIIGPNCIINSKALVEHGCNIGGHCHISTGAILNGGVEVEEKTFIGSNAIIVESAHINSDSFIKAGSLIK